ncbi:MAG: polysaccharide biosynthesis/export family protein [Chthoniobacterales bacterium]
MRHLAYIIAVLGLLASPCGAEDSTKGVDAPSSQKVRPAGTPTVTTAPAPAPAVQAVAAPAPPPTVSTGPATALSSGESDYILVIGDVIELNVFREPELTTQAIIARDGSVQLPLVREVSLAGLTIRDARELLRGLYDKQFLVNPQVFLNVVKYAQRKFTIMGQITRPGSYELQGGERMDILEAIGLAGGFTRVADRSRVTIQRKEKGTVNAIRANTKRMADGKEMPIEIQPGDVITVSESWF